MDQGSNLPPTGAASSSALAPTASLQPPFPSQDRRQRISERAVSFLRFGARGNRHSLQEIGSETSSITSGRSDGTPRGSIDARRSPDPRPLSYQPRIKPPVPAAQGSSAASREPLPSPAASSRGLQRPGQSAQAESSLHARLHSLLQEGKGDQHASDVAVQPEAAELLPAAAPAISPSSADQAARQEEAPAGPTSQASPQSRPTKRIDSVLHGSPLAGSYSQASNLPQHRSPPLRGDSQSGHVGSSLSSHQNRSSHLKKLKAVRRGAVPVVPSLSLSAALAAKASSTTLTEPPLSATSATSSRLSSGPSRSSSLGLASLQDPTSPTAASKMLVAPAKVQRPNIKVRIITWNMHDSLPKGDLEVLLGRAGIYVPPEDGWDIAAESEVEVEEEADESEENDETGHDEAAATAARDDQGSPMADQKHDGRGDSSIRPAAKSEEGKKTAPRRQQRGKHVVGQETTPRSDRIPPLPHDNDHPYHLLVVAGQECPWGDGKRLATGVGLATELGDIGKQKARAQAKEKEARENEARDKGKDKDKDKEKERDLDQDGDRKGKDKEEDLSVAAALSARSAVDEGVGAAAKDRDPKGPGSDQLGFPFHATNLSQSVHPSAPLLSPLIGGVDVPRFGGSPMVPPPTPGSTSLVDGVGEKVTSAANSIAGSWTGRGGKGWSDMCEDWFCRGPSTSIKDKDRALLARALSHSPSKRDAVHDLRQPFAMSLSQSHPGTPDLSRAASPDPIWSLPSTPGPSTPQMQATDLPSSSSSSRPAWRQKRDVPKLRLKVDSLAEKKMQHGDAMIQSPLESASVANRPRSPLSRPEALDPVKDRTAAAPATRIASSSSNNLLSVPQAPSFSRQSSCSSVVRADGTSLHFEPETADASARPNPVRSPSPAIYPAEAIRSDSGDDGVGAAAACIGIPQTESCDRLASAARLQGVLSLSESMPTLPDGTPKALGPYTLVIKERMMGCYMAVYVWRGCRDRIRGASRSHVKSGLLAGRVGNKGGVGISIKLGSTRLLFVNAHLAAHEGRVAVRLANVAKIKAALKVDSFLPPEDPRSKLEDITEQFDHCFWFGDLNFRIDISRRHADWLLMNKRYDQALAFDQLGKVLHEGDAFTGFKEAPIDFPPTYKYDVLKTLKPKRKKTVTDRILHRRAGSKTGGDPFPPLAESSAEASHAADVEGQPACDLAVTDDDAPADMSAQEDAVPPQKLVPSRSGDVEQPETSSTSPTSPPKPFRRASRSRRAAQTRLQKAERPQTPDPGALTDDDTSSVSSSAWDSVGSSSGFATNFLHVDGGAVARQNTTLSEAEQEAINRRIVEENTQAAQGRRLFSQGAAIKAKFRILGFVKAATGQKSSGPSEPSAKAISNGLQNGWERPRAKGTGNDVEADHRHFPPAEPLAISGSATGEKRGPALGQYDSSGSRLSNAGSSPSKPSPTTFGTSLTTQTSSASGTSGASGPDQGLGVNFGDLAEPSTAPPQNPQKQEGSAFDAKEPDARNGLSRTVSQSTQLSRSTSNACSVTAEQMDNSREQPYDTSAKQRVPSWCDRVLFRSTVPIEAESDDEEEPAPDEQGKGAHERLGSRVGTALSNALIAPLRQAAERRQAHRQASTSSALMAAATTTSSIALATEKDLPSTAVDLRFKDPVRSTSHSDLHDDPSATQADLSLVQDQPSHHLFQRLLRPKRRASKRLKPSRTIEPTMQSSNGVGMLPTMQMQRAISAVDLPSHLAGPGRQLDLASPSSLQASTIATDPQLAPSSALASSPAEAAAESPRSQPARPKGLRHQSDELLQKERPGSLHFSEVSPRESRPALISKVSWKSPATSEAQDGFALSRSSPTTAVGPMDGQQTQPQPSASPRSSHLQRRSSSQRRPRGRRSESESSLYGSLCSHRDRHPPSSLTPPSRDTPASRDWEREAQATVIRDEPLGLEDAVSAEVAAPSRSTGGWWMDHLSQHLPSFLTPALVALRGHDSEKATVGRSAVDHEGVEPLPELVGPKKGQVECLLYKSLDDREMRILEGRSDHRPVIFVGAIGV